MVSIEDMSIFLSQDCPRDLSKRMHTHAHTRFYSSLSHQQNVCLLEDSYLSAGEMMGSWENCQDRSKAEELFKVRFLKVTYQSAIKGVCDRAEHLSIMHKDLSLILSTLQEKPNKGKGMNTQIQLVFPSIYSPYQALIQ